MCLSNIIKVDCELTRSTQPCPTTVNTEQARAEYHVKTRAGQGQSLERRARAVESKTAGYDASSPARGRRATGCLPREPGRVSSPAPTAPLQERVGSVNRRNPPGRAAAEAAQTKRNTAAAASKATGPGPRNKDPRTPRGSTARKLGKPEAGSETKESSRGRGGQSLGEHTERGEIRDLGVWGRPEVL